MHITTHESKVLIFKKVIISDEGQEANYLIALIYYPESKRHPVGGNLIMPVCKIRGVKW